ncbi:M20 metallopeptidase family protein [Desulfoferrobacter suflitae]|uniref:M20 metallopeptidase family protein n=1 Tax=Desulfoferrobacter suflitae TaxID=2865782 RepID=UPI002164A270|nr:amidohydrolase [Desulfoferrobacter suflitae]MCK8601438.1 amidohydrolase [Desulfoferrobacter suflitae]
MEIKKEVLELNEEVIKLRRDFHQHPELGFEEFRTSQTVMEYLDKLGLKPKQITKTGVVATLYGKRAGLTVMLRADMDALPVQEENEVSYKSVHDGIMHACAHDGHTAMLLVAAKILCRHRDELAGNVKFVFEPNEENVAALQMIEDGVLEDPPVDACFGIHLWSTLESGKMAITAGPVMAGMNHFDLVIKGKGGHTATPQNSIDPILTAANVIQAVQAIQTREISVLQPTIIMFGQIEGGTASNIIPDKVTIKGTMRFLHATSEGEEGPEHRFERIVANTCKAYRADYQLDFVSGHPTLVNDQALTEVVRSVARKVLEESCAAEKIVSYVSLAGEDFSEFAARVPGVFYFIGAGNRQKQTDFPHHHPRFNIDEDVLKLGVEMHVRTAMHYLNREHNMEERG